MLLFDIGLAFIIIWLALRWLEYMEERARRRERLMWQEIKDRQEEEEDRKMREVEKNRLKGCHHPGCNEKENIRQYPIWQTTWYCPKHSKFCGAEVFNLEPLED